MKKIRFGLIGGGWRAEFFVRIAKALPEVFEITSVLFRDEIKAVIFKEKFGIHTTLSFEELVKQKPDYVILSVARTVALEFNEKLFKAGIPVLCETPPAATVEELTKLWELAKDYNGKIQIAEQYFVQPLYSAWLKAVQEGLLGEVSNINLSALHGYHGTNIIRNFLGITKENCTIYGKAYTFPVAKTGSREGKCLTGEIVEATRNRLTFEFENGKVAFFDFAGIQYHSSIRTRQLTVQGTRGEIDDLTIRYLNSANEVVVQKLYREDQGVYNNNEWAHYGLMLGERYLYKNPFPTARLNDDELAIATCMCLMKKYIETGEAFYSLQEALQDSYLALMMEKALMVPLTPIQTQTQPWYK